MSLFTIEKHGERFYVVCPCTKKKEFFPVVSYFENNKFYCSFCETTQTNSELKFQADLIKAFYFSSSITLNKV